jgi:hypothetical protein
VSTFATAVLPTYEEARPDVFVRRSELPGALLAAEADTSGWDVVHALRLPVVNATLQASGRYPDKFSHEMQPGWSIRGTFTPWKLVRGGSNSILFVRAPLAAATMTFTGTPDLEVTGGSVTVSVKLNYLPQPPPSARGAGASDEGETEYLATRSASRNPDDPPVVIQYVHYGSATPTPMQDALFRAAIAVWFNKNLQHFSYVFCALDINTRAAEEHFQWLKPTYTGYAYANGPTEETSTFGVLTMTQGNDPGGRINQLSPGAVPGDCTASVLISQRSFLRNLMVPGLTRAFKNTAVTDFLVEEGTVVNTRALRMEDIEVDGSTYHPDLIDLRLQVVGDELQLNTKVKINVSPGIDSFVVSTDYFRIVLVDRPEGGQTLDFRKSRPTARSDYTEKETWVVITEIIVAIIGAIAAIVAGIVIPGAGAALVAVLLIGLVAGLAAATPALIALVAGGGAAAALPSIGDLLTESTVDIHWPQAAGMTLTSAELNGSLQLGGHLRPSPEVS